MQKTQTSHNRFLILTCTIIVIVEGLLALQGFCMADEGWSLSGYQQIYHDPESVRYIFLFYNALWIGGLWESLFDSWGIYGFRILNILTIVASWVIIYRMLNHYVNRWAIFIGVLIVCLAHDYGVMVFDHSSVTVVLSLMAAACLVRSLISHDRRMSFAFGVCVAVNIFSRIPNLSQLALFLLFIPYYIHNRKCTATMRLALSAAAGVVTGVAAMMLFMLAVGHLGIFVDNLTAGMSAATSTDSSHNLGAMMQTYGMQLTQVAKNMVKVLIPPLLIPSFDNILYLYAFCTLTHLAALWHYRRDISIMYLLTTSLIMLYTLPLGSDFLIVNMGENSIWLATPLSVGIAWQMVGTINRRLPRYYIATIAGAFCIIHATFCCIHIGHNAYFDPGPRTLKTFRIDHPLANTYTTEAYKTHTDKILSRLRQYVEPGDYLFCFQNRPMLHYLTHTRPYMHNPWPWSYDNSMMELNMRQAEQRTEAKGEPWPVILREKGETIDFTQPDSLWNSTDATDTFAHKNRKVQLIQDFIARHHYSVVWEDKNYQILCTR